MSGDRSVVLIVDDAPEVLDLLRQILSPHYAVKVALNGEKALKIAQGSPGPNVIVLDVFMPNMSGYEVCESLRLQESTRSIPVIFLTGTVEDADVQRAEKLGAWGIHTKPPNPEQLLEAVASAIAGRP